MKALIEGIPPWLRRGAFYVATGCVVFVSWWPRQYTERYVADVFHRNDGIVHGIVYAALAAATLAAWGCRTRPWASRWRTWVGATLFGILMEIGQETIPGVNRALQLSDIISNAVGALVGVIAFLPAFWPAIAPSVTEDGSRREGNGRCGNGGLGR